MLDLVSGHLSSFFTGAGPHPQRELPLDTSPRIHVSSARCSRRRFHCHHNDQ